MLARNENLGLSLSIGSSQNHQHPQFNLISSISQRCDLLTSTERRQSREAARPLLKGIDVNRSPTAEKGIEEEGGTSSPNSTISSVTGKRDHGGEVISDEEYGEGPRKKLRLSMDQSAVLEETFTEHNTLSPKQKQTLAKQLNLRPRQVEVWFQNRRARTKLKQTEVDCEFLKRCYENLTDENRRLQKEVAELQALKLFPQDCMHMTPHSMLKMCPSGERVATSNNGGGGATTSSTLQANVEHRFLQHAQQQQRSFTGARATAMPWAPVPQQTASLLDFMHAQSS